MAALWQQDLHYAWNRLRSDGGFTWAGWRVVQHLYGGDPHYVVEDGNSKTVIRTTVKALAEMVAGIPELMEPDLRSGVVYVTTADGGSKQIPPMDAIGTDDPQESYDRGYRDGYQHGADNMEQTLDEKWDSESIVGDNTPTLGDPYEDNVDQPYIGDEHE